MANYFDGDEEYFVKSVRCYSCAGSGQRQLMGEGERGIEYVECVACDGGGQVMQTDVRN